MSRAGGQYQAGKDGKIKRVKAPTKDHPQGNRARGKGQEKRPTRVVDKPAKQRGK